MPTIQINDKDKREFEEEKPDEMTQAEFTHELLAAYRRDNGEIVDVDALVDRVQERTASEIETAAYRGVSHAIEETAVLTECESRE